MSTFDVHPRIAGRASMSRSRRVFVLALAAAIALAFLIASLTAAIRATSATSATALPQHRDMAPTRLFRDPETHSIVWTAAGDTPPAADLASQPTRRPRYPGK